jgi:hypothetical protein
MHNNDSLSNYEFAPDSQVEKMRKIFSHCFEISDFGKISFQYTRLRDEFYSREKKVEQKTIEKRFLKVRTETEKYRNAFNSSKSIGVDLPFLIGKKNSGSRKRVFILAQDPLRKETNEHGRIILSMPFAPQLRTYREKQGKVCWQFTQFLVEEGYDVYYTDLYKIWIKGSRVPRDLVRKFHKALSCEIETFKPDILITLGEKAKRAASKLNKNIGLLGLPHPSGSNNGWWKGQQGSASDEFKLYYFKNKFNEYRAVSTPA